MIKSRKGARERLDVIRPQHFGRSQIFSPSLLFIFAWQSPTELAASLGEFGVSIKSLGSSDSNEPLSSALTQLGDVQSKLKDIQLAQVRSPEQTLQQMERRMALRGPACPSRCACAHAGRV